MEGTKELQVKLSKEFNIDLDDVFQYGIGTFGIRQAEIYENEIWQLVRNLSHNPLLFPECRYLPTKSKMYRWIILDATLLFIVSPKAKYMFYELFMKKGALQKLRLPEK